MNRHRSALSSRGEITWDGVDRRARSPGRVGSGRDRRRAHPLPRGLSTGSSRSAASGSPGSTASRGPIPTRLGAGSIAIRDHGRARILVDAQDGRSRSRCARHGTRDGRRCSTANPSKFSENRAVFLNIEIPSGQHELILKYDPVEVRLGLAVSILLAGSLDSGVDRNSIVLDSWNNHCKGLGRTRALGLESIVNIFRTR